MKFASFTRHSACCAGLVAAFLMGYSAGAATNRWDAAAGLRPDQVLYRWPLNHTGSSPLPALAGGVLTISSTNALGDAELYIQSGDMLAVPTRLVIEAQMRYVSGASDHAARAPAEILFSTAAGVGNDLSIGPAEI